MLTPTGRAFLFAGVLLAGLGVGFGNLAFLAASAFPALLALAALSERPRPAKDMEEAARHTRRFAVRREVHSTTPRRGDTVTVEVEFAVPKGRGHVEVWQQVPDEFELVEGTNLRLFPLRRKARTEAFRFVFRASKRGPATLPPVRVEWHDPLGLAEAVAHPCGDAVEIEVAPKLPYLRRLPPIRAPATRFVPEGDPSPIGPPGTDFHEIRDYHWGDPPKAINWKATARRLSRGEDVIPLVNEYEREGRKTIWVFLDASGVMDVGTNVETALEHALEAGGAVAAHYLDRGYAVGMAAFNATTSDVLFPDHGRRQLRNILRYISRLQPTSGGNDLKSAVDRARRWFRGGRPMAVVLTRLAEPADATLDGITRLVAVCRGGARRGGAPVFVVDTRPWSALDKDEAPAVIEALDSPLAAEASRRGARVVPWRAGKERFESTFMNGVRRGGRSAARRGAR